MSEQSAHIRAARRRALTVRDVMRPPDETVEVDAHVSAAKYLMRHSGMDELVVTTDDANQLPIAVVTEADISRATDGGGNPEDLRISDIESERLSRVKPTTRLVDAAEIMSSADLQYVAVLEAGRLVGVLHIHDVRAALAAQPVMQQAHPQSQMPEPR